MRRSAVAVHQQVKQKHVPLRGGVDQSTPALEATPGSLLDSINFDVNVLGGYRGLDGYEKWDGQQLCNSHGFWTAYIASSGGINPGVIITGGTSGATGTVIGLGATGETYYAMETGTFSVGESISVLGVPVGSMTTAPFLRLDRADDNGASMMALSSTLYRASIQTVPGSGKIRGLQYYLGNLYAWRNNAGGTGCDIYKSSVVGWALVSLGNQISFTAGSGILVDGATLTQGAVTATIRRVVIESGSLGSSTAAGRLMITTPSGGAFTAGAATASGGGALTLSGASSAISHAANGRIRSELANFGAGSRMYFCSGVDYAFEFDGTVFVPIHSGMVVDKPGFIAVHKNHLFLAFDNSLQFSGIANPYTFSPLLGAGELNMGETITNLLPQPSDAQSGGAMVVSTRNSISVLYGSSAADFNLIPFQRTVGSIAHTIQNIAGDTYMLDDRGITNLTMVKEFGNFNASTISTYVRDWLLARKANTIDSCIVKEKNQYRVFFAGGTAMHITFANRAVSGMMPVQYADSICITHSTEKIDGTESVFYGDESGNVYIADSGPSFAGKNITRFFKQHFNHFDSPRVIKRFYKVTFDVGGAGFSLFQVGAELGYGNPDIGTQVLSNVDAQFAGTRWDDPAVVWDGSDVWDGRILLPVEVSLEGSEENISITVYQSSDKYLGLNFQAELIAYTTLRMKR
jgi:hypothetical protein